MPTTITYTVPCHNDGAFLPETLESIAQDIDASGLGAEKPTVIILNDGSTDNTAEVIEDACDDPAYEVIGLHSARPSGEGGARSKLFAAAHATQADYYRFVDADDTLVPGSTARMMEKAQQTGAIAVSGHYRLFGDVGDKKPMVFPEDDDEIRSLFRRNVTFPSAYALYDGAQMRATGLPKDMTRPMTADYELMIQLLSRGRVANLGADEPVVNYRRHPGSITASRMRAVLLEFVKISVANWRHPDLPPPALSDYSGLAKIAILGLTPEAMHPLLVKAKRFVLGSVPHV